MSDPTLENGRWTILIPKLKQVWPKLTDADFHQIEGNLELLVTKVSDRYGMKRPQILEKMEQLNA